MYKICLQRMAKRAQHLGEIIQFTLSISHVFPCAVGSLKKNSLGFLVCFKKHIRGQVCSRLTTVRLISSVLTVILLITGPAHRNAATTGASKEVDWTFKFSLICRTTGQKKTKKNKQCRICDNFREAKSILEGKHSTQPGQFLSSEKSPQSLLPSHTHDDR